MEKLCIFFVIALFINVALGQSATQENGGDLDDRYGFNGPVWFPGSNEFQRPPGGRRPTRFPQFPTQDPRTTTSRPTTPSATGTTTMSPQQLQCINNCPVTAEYNPVCGTNRVTYDNPGRLTCAQGCGINVSLLRTSPCPTPPPTVDGVPQQ